MPPQANAPAPAPNPLPQDPFGQIVDTLKSANNILITVSANPSIDQLSACIGLTLALNKLGKHGTAVFSGKVPPAISFLQPEKTIEANTDSLRDFIIALDKAKADKLRYKVEDQVVKIFITPYKTSISKKDLEFSQGDFNVDAVVALGVRQKTDLDTAIVSHGRILHDATVISINTSSQSKLGAIDWTNTEASSLCEMVSDILAEFGKDMFDTQISTALLTGVVVETDRFSNDKATPHTMAISGTLMSGGASTQLVASKLEEADKAQETAAVTVQATTTAPVDPAPPPDGTIQITHAKKGEGKAQASQPTTDLDPSAPLDDIAIDDHGNLQPLGEYLTIPTDVEKASKSAKSKKATKLEPPKPAIPIPTEPSPQTPPASSMVLEPPQFGGQLTANNVPEHLQYEAGNDPLSPTRSQQPILSRGGTPSDDSATADQPLPSPGSAASPAGDDIALPIAMSDAQVPSDDSLDELLEPKDKQTLTDIEKAVDSIDAAAPTATQPPIGLPPVDEIRSEVGLAADLGPARPEPDADLNALDTGIDLGHDTAAPDAGASTKPKAASKSSGKPPPVPPPMLPTPAA